MKFDAIDAEKVFATLQAGLTLHVMGQFNEYEQKLSVLIEEVKKLREENEKLHTELDKGEVPEVERR